jgi:ankyrin repeat protein
LEDHASNNELHLAIIRDDMDKFTKLVETEVFEKYLLNLRNSDGKSPLFLTIEHSRQQMFDTLFSKFESSIDFRSKDTLHGNTALHMACL